MTSAWTVLAAAVGVTVVVGAFAASLWLLHAALRPRNLRARSATALRELEPRGGRHRFTVRAFEQLALGGGSLVLVTVLLFLVPSTANGAHVVAACVAACLAVVLWWAWRRGTLRAFETEPRGAPGLFEREPPRA